ncbi:MAG: hypothetical protein ABGW69_02745 [Nanoarchaeota archaeon]
MKRTIKAIKEIEIPFFGRIYNLFLFIERIEGNTIFIKLSLPSELSFLKELIIFELKVIEKHYKKKVVISDGF